MNKTLLASSVITGILLSLCFCVAAAAPAFAQGSSGEVSPQVQQLYQQAMAAERSGNAATAIAKYRAMIRLAPDIAPAYNNLGMLLFNERDYGAAAPILAHGLRLNPHMGTSVVMLGLSYFELGDNRKAEPLLLEAVEADSSNADAQLSLARVLLNLGRTEDAIVHLRAYLKIKPKDQQAWYLLGTTYLKLSESALGKVQEINPNSFVSHEVAGEIDQSMHNYGGAMVQFKKAVNLAPQDPGTHLRLANTYWLMGKWGSAESEFQTALKLAPNDCQARWKLGNAILQANGSAKEALADFDRSIHECPKLMQAHVDRARALIEQSRQKEALPDLLLAEKSSPDEPMIHYYLASVYRAEGKMDEARNQLRIYAQLQQKSNEAKSRQVQEELKLKGSSH